jgi:hypothetical protein
LRCLHKCFAAVRDVTAGDAEVAGQTLNCSPRKPFQQRVNRGTLANERQVRAGRPIRRKQPAAD